MTEQDTLENRCLICGAVMTSYPSVHRNCGGDCLSCMAEAGDPDCEDELASLLETVPGHEQKGGN